MPEFTKVWSVANIALIKLTAKLASSVHFVPFIVAQRFTSIYGRGSSFDYRICYDPVHLDEIHQIALQNAVERMLNEQSKI